MRRSNRRKWARGFVVLLGVGAIVSLRAAAWELQEACVGPPYRPAVPASPPLPAPNGFDMIRAAIGSLGQPAFDTELDYLVVARVGHDEICWNSLSDAQKRRHMAQRIAAEQAILRRHARARELVRQALNVESACPAQRAFSADILSVLGGALLHDDGARFPTGGPDASDLGRLISMQSEVFRWQGRYADAADACLDAFALANAVSRCGNTADYGAACDVRDAVRQELVTCVDHLNAPDAQRLGHRLQSLLDGKPLLEDAWREERDYLMAAVPACFDPAPTRAAYLPNFPVTEVPDYLPSVWLGGLARHTWRVGRDRTLHELERYCGQAAEASNVPYVRRVRPSLESAGDLTQGLGQLLDLERDLRAPEAMDRLLCCQLAVQAFHRQRRCLPASLGLLGLPATYTTDPFTGAPFRYKPKGKGYLLYSVGLNGRDDGGVWDYDGEKDLGLHDGGGFSKWAARPVGQSARVEHMTQP